MTLLVLCLSLAGVGTIAGCDRNGAAVELTEDEIEQAERRSIERLKELGCRIQEVEDHWLKTTGILIKLFPEHMTESGTIRDNVFSEFRYIRRLSLDVDATPISTDGLARLRELGNLLLLSAQQTELTDDGLAQIEGVVSLRLLRLNWTRVTDRGLRHIERLPDLQMLYLTGTQITDSAMTHLGELTELSALQLAHSRITDAGLSKLDGLVELTHLDLSSTSVSDVSVPVLAGLKKLQYLNLDKTKVTPEGLLTLRQELPDCHVVLTSRATLRAAAGSIP